MLRASRREDRKRVPQYSSPPRGGRTGIFREVSAGLLPGTRWVFHPRLAVHGPHPLGWEFLREFFVEGVRHARPRGSEEGPRSRKGDTADQVPERYDRDRTTK
ncbi:hypothetical protein GCM10019017_33850 [Streptomyces showdoensis]